jgi:hypothetical protein
MDLPTTQISLEIAAAFVTQVFKEAAKGTTTWFKNQDILGTSAQKYADNMLREYSTIKVLGMTQPIPLTQLYVSLHILEKITARIRTDVASLEKLFDYDRKGFGNITQTALQVGAVVNKYQKIIALGKPGAGKTTLLKYIAHLSFDAKYFISRHRLPVFIGLNRFAEDEKKPSLAQAIMREFDLCGIAADQQGFVEKLLNEGDIRLLLDGLDEVNAEHLDRTLQAVEEFDQKYRNNQIIITCRTAAYNHYLQHFTDVEVADFNEEQKERFVNNYFVAEPHTATACWQQIKGNRSLKELACNPLLLTLLCIAFNHNNNFPSDRGRLYHDAAEALLQEWDNSRRIDRPTLYKNLSLQRKIAMLSGIAYHTFVENRYFAPASLFEQYIADYIENLPDAAPDKIHADAAEILREIDAQHSIITERAHSIYSFSHLTLQEYFAANYIKETNLLHHIAQNYMADPRWREVFLLTTNLLTDASPFIKAMQEHIDNLVAQSPALIQLLQAVENTLLPQADNKFATQIIKIKIISLMTTLCQILHLLRTKGEEEKLNALINDIIQQEKLKRKIKSERNIAITPTNSQTVLTSFDQATIVKLDKPAIIAISRIWDSLTALSKVVGTSSDKIINFTADGDMSIHFEDDEIGMELAYYFVQNSMSYWAAHDYDALTNYLTANQRLMACLKTENYMPKEMWEAAYSTLFSIPAALAETTAVANASAVQVFYSYVAADVAWVEKLEAHLSPLKRNGTLHSTWHQAQVLPGDAWSEVVLQQLRQAQIILLLVSAKFIASDHAWEKELTAALARQQAGKAKVIPIIVQDCLWQETLLGKFVALPNDASSLSSHPNPDQAMRQIAAQVQRYLEYFRV